MREFDLRKLQLVELEMLKDVTAFCDENNIKYWLDSGTLLGAVRHGGFIPWDDDIDISMDYHNYKKFLKLAPKGLPSKYFVQNFRTDPKVAIRWSRVRINGTTSMEADMTDYHIHYGICMDVFLRSGISSNPFRQLIADKCLGIMSQLLVKYYAEVKGISVPRKFQLLYLIIPEKIRILLIRVLERIAILDESKCEQCFNTWWPSSVIAKRYPTNLYFVDNRKKILFEDSLFWAPKDSDKYLEIAYGNWEVPPPIDDRGGHGDIIVDFENDYSVYFTTEKQ